MYADAFFHDEPRWSYRPGRRLAFNFLLAALIVAGVLAAVRMPVFERAQPLAELFVRILISDVEETAESPFVEEAAPTTPETSAPDAAAPPRDTDVLTSAAREQTDWYALLPDAARATLDAQPPTYSVNPGFDEKRRAAAEQFRPSEAPVERPIWENVEKDQLGRTVLVSGDCWRVIDDPNVGSREAFETFGQYITMCAFYKRPPQKLGFVDPIRNRRAGQARYGHPAAE